MNLRWRRLQSSRQAVKLQNVHLHDHRVNIGNARLYGLEEDLNMNSTQFQTAVSILFVTYILSEVPSNLVLHSFQTSSTRS